MKTIEEIIRHAESVTDGWPLDDDERAALRILMEQAQQVAFARAAKVASAVAKAEDNLINNTGGQAGSVMVVGMALRVAAAIENLKPE
jgi:hypothetical protein